MSPDKDVLGKYAEDHERHYTEITETHEDEAVRALAHGNIFMSRQMASMSGEISGIAETLESLPTAEQIAGIVKSNGDKVKETYFEFGKIKIKNYGARDVCRFLILIMVALLVLDKVGFFGACKHTVLNLGGFFK